MRTNLNLYKYNKRDSRLTNQYRNILAALNNLFIQVDSLLIKTIKDIKLINETKKHFDYYEMLAIKDKSKKRAKKTT